MGASIGKLSAAEVAKQTEIISHKDGGGEHAGAKFHGHAVATDGTEIGIPPPSATSPLADYNVEATTAPSPVTAETSDARFDRVAGVLHEMVTAGNVTDAQKLFDSVSDDLGKLSNEDLSRILELALFPNPVGGVEATKAGIADMRAKIYGMDTKCKRVGVDAGVGEYFTDIKNFLLDVAVRVMCKATMEEYVAVLKGDEKSLPLPNLSLIELGKLESKNPAKMDKIIGSITYGVPCYGIDCAALEERFERIVGAPPRAFDRLIVFPPCRCSLSAAVAFLAHFNPRVLLAVSGPGLYELAELDVLERICLLYLAVAVGHVNGERIDDEFSITAKRLLEIAFDKMLKAENAMAFAGGCEGTITSDDFSHIAAALHVSTVIVDYSPRENHCESYFFSASGLSMHVTISDVQGEGDGSAVRLAQPVDIAHALEDKRSVVLYRIMDENHFAAVMPIPELLSPVQQPEALSGVATITNGAGKDAEQGGEAGAKPHAGIVED
jgi:hypothetical protein